MTNFREFVSKFASKLANFYIYIVLLLQMACFKMEMPEYSESNSPALEYLQQAKHSVALIAVDSTPQSGSTFDETLGYQFVLGAFPLTRLSFDEGAEFSIRKILLEELELKGYQTFLVKREDLGIFQRELKPDISLAISVEELSINAYDLIILRKAVADWGIVINYSFEDDSLLSQRVEQRVRREKFVKSASADYLAEVFFLESRKAIRALLALLTKYGH